MSRPTLFDRMSQMATPARAPRRLSPEMRAVLERVRDEAGGLGIPLEQGSIRRELIARRLISGRHMKAGHRYRYVITEEGLRSLAAVHP